MTRRPFTRLGTISIAAHLGYEVLAGVALPLAPHIGVRAAAAAFAVPATGAYLPANRLRSPRGDRTYAMVNGLFLAAVAAHYTSWPRVWRHGLPWLTECEGLTGPVLGPYNVILQASAAFGALGLWENRSSWRWGVATAAVATPALRWVTPHEYTKIMQQAADHPRWWNRRLRTATT